MRQLTLTGIDEQLLRQDIEAKRAAWQSVKTAGGSREETAWDAYMAAVDAYHRYVRDLRQFSQALGGC